MWILVNRFENGSVHEGCLNGFEVETRAKDPKGRSMFVCTMKDGPVKRGLEGVDRGFSDVMS